jgi:hypothetical protein
MASTTPKAPEGGSNEQFFRYFQEQVTGICLLIGISGGHADIIFKALQAQLSQIADNSTNATTKNQKIDQCLAGIAKLSNEVKDASNYIPPYDQRTYSGVCFNDVSFHERRITSQLDDQVALREASKCPIFFCTQAKVFIQVCSQSPAFLIKQGRLRRASIPTASTGTFRHHSCNLKSNLVFGNSYSGSSDRRERSRRNKRRTARKQT